MKVGFFALTVLLCVVSLAESLHFDKKFSGEGCGGVLPCKKRHERRSSQVSKEAESSEESEEKKHDHKPEPVPVKPTPLPEHRMKFSCEGLRDGFYSHGCSRFYVKCVSEKVLIKQCPHHLRYDVITRTCITAVEVRACKRDSGEKDHKRCSLARSGFVYTRECSSSFVACIAREPVPMKCPHDHIFDSVTYKCVSRCTIVGCKNVPSCGKPHKPIYPRKRHEPASQERHFDCERRPDGFYELGCSSKYISCLKGIAKPMFCTLPSHRYDVSAGGCNVPKHVPVCGGIPEPKPYKPHRREHSFRPPFECGHRRNGPYALGCSSQFVMCTSGVVEYARCGHGLKFDEHSRHCKPKPRVCGERFFDKSE